ncbi:MAG: PAS domain S-box protein [Myxococcales bacterium]|nr:PAS domain S-box protein [Myxococcales bacterium]
MSEDQRNPSSPADPLGLGPAWSALAEHSNDFVGLMDERGVALFMNRSVRDAPGEAVEGKLLEEFLSPERAKQIREMIAQTRRTGRISVNDRLRVITLDGRERWFVEKCVPLQTGDGHELFMLVRTETTDVLRAEAALRASENRYLVLFESHPDAVLVYDPTSLRFLAVNSAAANLYGWSREELLTLSYADLHPEEDSPELLDLIAAISREPERQRQRLCRQKKRGGEVFRSEVIDNPIELDGRRVRIAAHRDVTERERLENQLRHAQKMEAIGMFAGGVAHDFNNLLGIIAGFTEAARESLRPGSEAAEDLANVLEASARGGELTKKLLVFSRKELFRFEQLDLSVVTREFSAMLTRIVGEDVTLAVEAPAEALPVLADRTQLEQIILNLATNARQAMPNGGKLRISTCELVVDAAYIAQHPWASPGHVAELCVMDSGVGMDASTLARSFEPFFTTKRDGTGLGLAVVHGIVKQHSGAIGVESVSGQGTTVRVQFPLATTRAPQVTLPPRRAASRGTERLLVAEDEPLLRLSAERSLSRLGYRVISTGDGEEAVDAFERTPDDFDLVVLDVVMPRLGGREALDRMRSRRPNLKVLFVTGYAPESTGISEALTDPELDLLRKPFTSSELAERVRAVLERR